MLHRERNNQAVRNIDIRLVEPYCENLHILGSLHTIEAVTLRFNDIGHRDDFDSVVDLILQLRTKKLRSLRLVEFCNHHMNKSVQKHVSQILDKQNIQNVSFRNGGKNIHIKYKKIQKNNYYILSKKILSTVVFR